MSSVVCECASRYLPWFLTSLCDSEMCQSPFHHEGCAVQTVTVLRKALAERVFSNLFAFKVDRCMVFFEHDSEDGKGP